MNRRELFKGLAAAFVAAQLPVPLGAIENLQFLPDNQVIRYLKHIRNDLMNRIILPACIMHEDGKIEMMPTKSLEECLIVVNNLIEELNV